MSFSQLLSQVTTNLATSNCCPYSSGGQESGNQVSAGGGPSGGARGEGISWPGPASSGLLRPSARGPTPSLLCSSPHSDSAERTRGWEPVSVHECVCARVHVRVRVHLHIHALPPCEHLLY